MNNKLTKVIYIQKYIDDNNVIQNIDYIFPI